MATVMFATSVYTGGIEVQADGIEGDLVGGESTVTSGTISAAINEDGYYPASLEYFISDLDINVIYSDGTEKTWRNLYWESSDYDNDYRYLAWADGMNCFNIRFYDEEGNQVNITKEHVVIGEFTMNINRNEEEPFYSAPIKILEPVSGTVGNNSASFVGTDSSQMEECWYELTPEKDKEYIYTASADWKAYSGFAGIWIKDSDTSVKRLCDGINQYGIGNSYFAYTADGENTLYMVIGETSTADFSGTITWNPKRAVSSIEAELEASYKAWNRDLVSIPLTVTYTDGTTEVIDSWNYGASGEWDDTVNDYVYTEYYYAQTANNEFINIEAYEGEKWVSASTPERWKSGEETWVAYLENDKTINDSFSVTIAAPTISNLTFKDAETAKFSVSAEKEAYYTFVPESDGQLELLNSGSKDLYVYLYNKESGVWNSKQSSLVSGGKSTKIYVEASEEYLVILHTKNETSGTIGKYTVGTSKSAKVDVTALDASDYTNWAKLPITVSFVGSDKETEIGKQTISVWDMNYLNSGVGYADTKYGERVYYALYKGTTKVDVPVLSEEFRELVGEVEDEEILDMYLREFGFPGGVKGLKIPAGNYTVKIYLGSVSDENVIGTSDLKVTDKSVCTAHQWNKGTLNKRASFEAAGQKTFKCTNCGETKVETIAKLASVKLSATLPTYTGNQISPTVTVKDANGKTLVKGSDYTVSYGTATRKNTGRYSVTVSFKGNYKANDRKLWFTIVPKAPATMNAELYGYDDVKVTWSKCTGASGYAVYYKKATASTYTLLGRTTNLYMKTDKKVDLADGVNYNFKVVPYYKNSAGTIYQSTKFKTDTLYTLKKLAAPTIKTSDAKVKVTWKNIPGETGYQISKSTSSTGTSIVLTTKTTTGVSSTIKATKGKKYFYKVRAYKVIDSKGTKVYGPWSNATAYKR